MSDQLRAEERVEEVAEAYLHNLRQRRDLLAECPEVALLLQRELRLMERMHVAADTHTGESAQTARQAVAAPLPGPARSRLGRYLLREELGRGGSATVYRAYDPRFDRDVALKVVRDDRPATAEAAARFERDARIAAQLRHPHIVPLHEAGVDDGVRYIDMELIRGPTLEARLQGGSLSFRETAELVRKLAEALHYAHEQGIVHRDVKPSNVLLDERGEPQLTDFGLARRANGEATLTEPGQILGSVDTMSPEQAGGHAHAADRRTDVYSLGAVLYRLLTGRPPFDNSGIFAERLSRILYTSPQPPRAVRADVPRDLEVICLKAMAREPNDRFSTAAHLADELRRWQNDEPLVTRSPSVWEQARRWTQRNRLLVVTASAMVLGVALAAAMAWGMRVDRLHEKAKQLQAEYEVRQLIMKARLRLESSWFGRRAEVRSLLLQIAEPRRQLPPGELREELDLAIRSTFAESLALFDVEGVHQTELGGRFDQAWPVALHPLGNKVIIGTPLGPWPWIPGESLVLPDRLDISAPRPRLAYSPNGQTLAFAPADGGLILHNGESLAPVATLEDRAAVGGQIMLAIGFSADSREVFACREDGRLRAWSVPDGNLVAERILPVSPQPVTAAAFDAARRRFALGDAAGRIAFASLTKDEPCEWSPLGESRVAVLALSPDGEWLASSHQDGRLFLRPPGEEASPQLFLQDSTHACSLLFSADGRFLFVNRVGVGVLVFDLVAGGGALRGRPNPGNQLRGEGQRLAWGNDTHAHVLDLLPPVAFRSLAGHMHKVMALAWAGNGTRLATLDSGLEVRTWDTRTGEQRDVFHARKRGLPADSAALALSDDGRLVALATGGNDGAEWILRAPAERGRVGRQVTARALPSGIEIMRFSGGKFILVREEDDEEAARRQGPGSRPSMSVLYQFDEEGRELLRRVIRQAGPDDVRRILNAAISADGRRFAWVGPRKPAKARRCEVYDLPGGGAPRTFPFSTDEKVQFAGLDLSPDGRFLRLLDPSLPFRRHYDLKEPSLPPLDVDPNERYASAAGWRLRDGFKDSTYEADPYALYRKAQASAWLFIRNQDGSDTEPLAFSPDGRSLAWGSRSGVITVVDLPALEEQVEQFEKELRGD